MEAAEAEACSLRAREVARTIHAYVREREAEYKQRDRFNRHPQQLPPSEAVAHCLGGELLDAFTAEMLIRELGRAASAPLALAVLDHVSASQPEALTKGTFDAAVTACASEYLPGEAIRVYAAMAEHGFAPDVRSANMAISACSHGGDIAGVLRVLDDMDERGVAPNEFTGEAALQACLYKRQGRYEDAVSIVLRLSERSGGRAPSAEVADAVISVCVASISKATSLDGSFAAFNALKSLGMHTCTRAYNAVVRACALKGAWQAAQGYYDEMVEMGVPADTSTFNSLIKACLSGGALHNALGIFEWMVSGKRVGDVLPADIDTFNTLIRACHQAGQLEKALEIMAWMQRSGLPFNAATYEELIGVTEVAEMWDAKAIAGAAKGSLAVFPSHLRPAPFDAMRLAYLEHLQDLEGDEEVLAAAKLGGVSWVSASLTRGDIMGGGGKLPPGSAAFSAFKTPRTNPPPPPRATPVVFSRAPSLNGMGATAKRHTKHVHGLTVDTCTPSHAASGGSGGGWTPGSTGTGAAAAATPRASFTSPGARAPAAGSPSIGGAAAPSRLHSQVADGGGPRMHPRNRGFLLAVIEAVDVGDSVLAWTRTILTHTYASANVNGFISAPRRYAAGVRQGCPAAPALFLFLGHALACFLRTCPAVGVEVVPGCRVVCPQYADDCMPLLRSCAPADVAALVQAMAVFGRATGLILNLGKCGILPLGSAGAGLVAGAQVAGLRVLDAGVSLGVPVSAGLPPPECVTGVCRERLAAAYTKVARFPMSSFGMAHAAATYGVSRISFRAVQCGMTPEAVRLLSRCTAVLVDQRIGPTPPASLPGWASSVPGVPARLLLGRPAHGGFGAPAWMEIVHRQWAVHLACLFGAWAAGAPHLLLPAPRAGDGGGGGGGGGSGGRGEGGGEGGEGEAQPAQQPAPPAQPAWEPLMVEAVQRLCPEAHPSLFVLMAGLASGPGTLPSGLIGECENLAVGVSLLAGPLRRMLDGVQALGPVPRIPGCVRTAELWGAEAPLWANPLLRLELPDTQRMVEWREPPGAVAVHALFSGGDATRWRAEGPARVRSALPGMRTVADLCALWAWLAAVNMLRAVVDERRVRRAATVEAALALDHGPHGGPRTTNAQVCAGLRGLEAAVPALWRVPLLNARKEPIWRLWRGRRHLWRITRPRDGVLPLGCAAATARAGELATTELWDALAAFAEGGVVLCGWAAVVGPTHPFIGVVDGGLTLNKTS
ncbi:hypothetical protein FOA52_010911 [Chlamydomonas sp. UWO 241]|nr:hypothetical protein FOA52_010911 [Chlamydomonas sp. UWO 241]